MHSVPPVTTTAPASTTASASVTTTTATSTITTAASQSVHHPHHHHHHHHHRHRRSRSTSARMNVRGSADFIYQSGDGGAMRPIQAQVVGGYGGNRRSGRERLRFGCMPSLGSSCESLPYGPRGGGRGIVATTSGGRPEPSGVGGTILGNPYATESDPTSDSGSSKTQPQQQSIPEPEGWYQTGRFIVTNLGVKGKGVIMPVSQTHIPPKCPRTPSMGSKMHRQRCGGEGNKPTTAVDSSSQPENSGEQRVRYSGASTLPSRRRGDRGRGNGGRGRGRGDDIKYSTLTHYGKF